MEQLSHLFLRTMAITGLLMVLIPGINAMAQTDVEYSAKLDTNIIVIGDQINMELSVTHPKEITVDFPFFSDSITSGVEIISQHPLDTLKTKDGRLQVKKNILITSFDGGVHKIPPMEFTIHQKNFVNVIRTDTLALGVHTFEVDTTKGSFDIVMPYKAPVSFAEVAPWVLGGILILGLVALLIYFIRQHRRNKPLFSRAEKPKDPPHVVALNRLDKLKNQKLWQNGKVKEYHTALTDTLREYIEQRFSIPTMERTSDQILEDTQEQEEITRELQSQLQDILMRADLVKFAKLHPLPDENDRSISYAYQIIQKTLKKEVVNEKSDQEDQIAQETNNTASNKIPQGSNKNNEVAPKTTK